MRMEAIRYPSTALTMAVMAPALNSSRALDPRDRSATREGIREVEHVDRGEVKGAEGEQEAEDHRHEDEEAAAPQRLLE